MPRIESSKRRYARKTSQRFKAWLIQKSRKARQAIDIICRYFSTFDGSTSYAALTDEIVLSGDFEIELDFIAAAFPATLLGSTASNSYLKVNSATQITIDGGSGSHSFTVAAINLNEKYKLKLSYLSGALSLNIDDSSYAASATLGTVLIENIGKESTSLLDGQLSDLKIWSNGDRTTGDLILDLPMDEGLKDVYDEVFYRNRVQTQAEWLLNFNGGYSSHQRLWNPDAADPSFSLEAYFDPSINGTIVSQNVSGTTTNREFQFFSISGSVRVFLGGVEHSILTTGSGLYRADFDGSNYTLFKDGTQVGSTSASIGTAREPSADFRIGVRNDGSGGAGYAYYGTIKDVKFWVNGTKSTGDLVLDSAINDNSNIIANAASPVNSNVWDDSQVFVNGESEILGGGSYRVYSSDGSYSTVKINSVLSPASDYMMELELVSGDIQNIIPQESTTNFSGWENVRDTYGQPTNRYKTLINSPYTYLQLKRLSGVTDVTVKNITAREVEGYGVLQGTRGTDYNWINETPHAIGYNVETNEVCTTDGTNWIDADLWNDSDAWSD